MDTVILVIRLVVGVVIRCRRLPVLVVVAPSPFLFALAVPIPPYAGAAGSMDVVSFDQSARSRSCQKEVRNTIGIIKCATSHLAQLRRGG